MPYIDWTGPVELREADEGWATQDSTIHVLGEQLDRRIREMFPEQSREVVSGRAVTQHGRLRIYIISE